MKIAVVAANGRVANKVITEAVNRGIEVTAFGRGDNNTQAQTYVKKDIGALSYGYPALLMLWITWTDSQYSINALDVY